MESVPSKGGGGVGARRAVRARGLVAGLLPVVLAGCHTYRVVEPEVVVPGDQLRVELTRQAASDLPAAAFPFGGTTLRGDLATRSGAGLVLRVPMGAVMEGTVTRTLGQELELSSADMVRVYRRTFEPVRTGLSVLGAAGVVVLVVKAFGNLDNEPDPDPPIPPGEGFRIPLFSIPMR
jgi:hypothetical protein